MVERCRNFAQIVCANRLDVGTGAPQASVCGWLTVVAATVSALACRRVQSAPIAPSLGRANSRRRSLSLFAQPRLMLDGDSAFTAEMHGVVGYIAHSVVGSSAAGPVPRHSQRSSEALRMVMRSAVDTFVGQMRPLALRRWIKLTSSAEAMKRERVGRRKLLPRRGRKGDGGCYLAVPCSEFVCVGGTTVEMRSQASAVLVRICLSCALRLHYTRSRGGRRGRGLSASRLASTCYDVASCAPRFSAHCPASAFCSGMSFVSRRRWGALHSLLSVDGCVYVGRVR